MQTSILKASGVQNRAQINFDIAGSCEQYIDLRNNQLYSF